MRKRIQRKEIKLTRKNSKETIDRGADYTGKTYDLYANGIKVALVRRYTRRMRYHGNMNIRRDCFGREYYGRTITGWHIVWNKDSLENVIRPEIDMDSMSEDFVSMDDIGATIQYWIE